MNKCFLLLMLFMGIKTTVCIQDSIVDIRTPKLVFSMIMKDEADRKLRECLEEIREYAKVVNVVAVIIDDNSTDTSVTLADEILQAVPHRIIHNDRSKFANEIELRKQQWDEALKENPDWIMNIDADHVWEKAMRTEIYKLINQDKVDVWCFRLYDFWDESHYRDDAIWCAHNTYRSFLIRYKKDFNYTWRETPQHCGHFPKNIYELPYGFSSMRLKHYGWAKKEDREAKFARYQKLDPGAKYGSQTQYDSALDSHPHLIEWVE